MAKANKETKEPTARDTAVGLVIVFVIGGWLLSGDKKADEVEPAPVAGIETPQAAEAEPVPVHVPTVESTALTTYDSKSSPKLAKAWGVKGLKRIEKAAYDAAWTVANNPTCDAVWNAGYSFTESKATSKIVIFVDCRNGNRYYVPEGATEVRSAKEELGDFTDRALINTCEGLIKDDATVKSSVKFRWFPDVMRYDHGNAIVYHRFSAKNAFGVTFDFRARCNVDRSGHVKLSPVEQV